MESLAELAAAKLDPHKGALFHAAGSAVAGDLAGLLSGRGFELRRSMIYEARPADSLSPAMVGAPSDYARYRHERRRVKAYQALTHGFAAIATGDAAEAKRRAKQAGALLKDAPLARLLQAQTAELEGDRRSSARHLQALLSSPETSFLALRGLFHQAMADGKENEALRLARQAVTERPGTSWAVSALLDLELKRGDIAAAEKALDSAERARLIEAPRAKRIRAVLLTERARQAPAEELAGAIDRLRQATKLAPDLVGRRTARHG